MMNACPTPIYLDHNATTPVFPEVVEAMRACWAKPYLNPASQHSIRACKHFMFWRVLGT